MMTNHDMSFLNKAQSTIYELKLILIHDDCEKILPKLDNMFMVFIFKPLKYSIMHPTLLDVGLRHLTIPKSLS